jgi:hypothetical protein
MPDPTLSSPHPPTQPTQPPHHKELEAGQAQVAMQLGAARLLESTTSKALDQFKEEAAKALARHEEASKTEAEKTVALTQQFDEGKREVRVWVHGLGVGAGVMNGRVVETEQVSQ